MNDIITVIVTYNVGDSFRNNIYKIKEVVSEIIVVDNGSNEQTINMLREIENDFTLISLGENKGIAYALNKGIECGLEKGCKWILTLDHDSIPKKDMLDKMLEVYSSLSEEEKDNIVMITPQHVEEKNSETPNNSLQYEYVLTEITSGALTKAGYYNKNNYDEKLFIDLVDHDFCLGIYRNGYKIIRVNESILLHNLGESEVKNIFGFKVTPTNHSSIRRYYMSRNRQYIWYKYKNDFKDWVMKDKIRAINEIIKIILFEENKLEKLKMIYIGIKDYRLKKWGNYYAHHD